MFTYLSGNAQCPAPSNLTVTTPSPLAAELSWTENGTATAWEIVVIPDYVVGTPAPTSGFIFASSNPFIVTNLPPGCNVFFVRSVCSAVDVSPWTAVASFDCSSAVYVYVGTLSIDSFSLNADNNELKIYPNPVKNNLIISNKKQAAISLIQLFNTLGQLVQVITNPNEMIDVSNLKTGCYFIKIVSDKGTASGKFLKE